MALKPAATSSRQSPVREVSSDLIHSIVAGGVDALVVLARNVGKGVLDKEVHSSMSSRK